MRLIGKFKALFKRKPKSFYSTISVEQYSKLQQIITSDADDLTKMSKVVYIIKGVDIMNLPMYEAQELMNEVTEHLQTPLQYEEVKDVYVIGGVKCKITPMGELTISQFADYQELVKDVNGNLAQILSVFLVPQGAKYNDGSYDYIAHLKAIKESPIGEVIGVVPFLRESLGRLFKKVLLSSAVALIYDKKLSLKKKREALKMLIRAEMETSASSRL